MAAVCVGTVAHAVSTFSVRAEDPGANKDAEDGAQQRETRYTMLVTSTEHT
jgi:hypothetical protein